MLPSGVHLWGSSFVVWNSCCPVVVCIFLGASGWVGGWVRGVVATLVQFQSAGKVLTHAVTMFPSGDVRRELIPVLAVIATHVAFKGITEPVTAHVDGVHDMI